MARTTYRPDRTLLLWRLALAVIGVTAIGVALVVGLITAL